MYSAKVCNWTNKCITDDTKAAAHQSPNCIKNKKIKYGENQFSIWRMELLHCITDIGHWMSTNRLKLNKEKTVGLWVGSRYSLSALEGCGPALRLDADTVEAKDHVRVLGVTFSADLTLDRHVSNISAACFYRLRQLRRVRRPLDSGSAVTLVNALVTSRIDYCNAVFAKSPKATTDKLQRVLNAATRIVTGTQKYDRRLTRMMRDELHWLSVPQRVKSKLGTVMHRCLHNSAPRYLCDYCVPACKSVGSMVRR